MSVEYSAIAAKLKAMYSKFLTRDDYEQLLERKSVNDICSYLKSTPGYGEVLEQVNERDIHRGQMEILLEQEMVDEYVRLYNMDAKDNIQEYHMLRPIPQNQLDAVTNKDEFTQNPGYTK